MLKRHLSFSFLLLLLSISSTAIAEESETADTREPLSCLRDSYRVVDQQDPAQWGQFEEFTVFAAEDCYARGGFLKSYWQDNLNEPLRDQERRVPVFFE